MHFPLPVTGGRWLFQGKIAEGKPEHAEQEAAQLPAEFWVAKVKQLIRLWRPDGDLAVMKRPELWVGGEATPWLSFHKMLRKVYAKICHVKTF